MWHSTEWQSVVRPSVLLCWVSKISPMCWVSSCQMLYWPSWSYISLGKSQNNTEYGRTVCIVLLKNVNQLKGNNPPAVLGYSWNLSYFSVHNINCLIKWQIASAFFTFCILKVIVNVNNFQWGSVIFISLFRIGPQFSNANIFRLEFRFWFWLGWYSIINNLIII